MNSDYSYENFKKRREAIKNKQNSEPKSLLRLFGKTFGIALLMFFVLATIISPHINIPALNDDSENVKNMSSSDFKSRIDYRLQQIKFDDQMPGGRAISQGETQGQDSNELVKVDLSNFNSLNRPDLKTANIEPPTIKKEDIAIALPKSTPSDFLQKQKSSVPVQSAPAPYVPKSLQGKNYKILLGGYSTPEDAQKLADMLSSVPNTTIKPFIKSHNGLYSVQVGSYNDVKTAQTIANAYKSKNYKVKIIEQ